MDPSTKARGWLMASSSAAIASFSVTTPTLPSAGGTGAGTLSPGGQDAADAWLTTGRVELLLLLLELLLELLIDQGRWRLDLDPFSVSLDVTAAASLAGQQSLPLAMKLQRRPPHSVTHLQRRWV